MKLPQFLYIPPGLENPELGAGLILQTAKPFYLGKIYRCKNDAESMRILIDNPPLAYSNVLGYCIYIAFYGSLDKNERATDIEWKKELQQILHLMAEFYEKEKVAPKRSFYKKFKQD